MNKLITLTLVLINMSLGFMNYNNEKYGIACFSFANFGMMIMLLITQIVETKNPNQNG